VSISTYTDVWCDVCGNWEQRATSKSGREARETAKHLGWRVSLPGGLDVCPACVALGKMPTEALGSS
jgi:hypothetical protein